MGITKEPCDANYDHGLDVADLVVMLNNWEQADPYDPPFVRTRDSWFIETARRLWNGRALEGRCELDQWRHACIDAPADVTSLRFELWGPADVDLYVTSGTHSRSTRWDLKSDGPTGNETIVVDATTTPPAGPARWFVAVHGVQASDFVLTATITTQADIKKSMSNKQLAISNEQPAGRSLSPRGTQENEQLAMNNKQLATGERNVRQATFNAQQPTLNAQRLKAGVGLETRPSRASGSNENPKLETVVPTMTIGGGRGVPGGMGSMGVALSGQAAKTVAINATVLYDSAILSSPTVRTAGIASGHRIKYWEKQAGELHFLIFSDIPTPLGGMAGESGGNDEIARIEFRVASSATSGTQTQIRFSDVFPNDADYEGVRGTALGDYDGKSTTPTLVNGTFAVVEPPPPGVVPSYWQVY